MMAAMGGIGPMSLRIFGIEGFRQCSEASATVSGKAHKLLVHFRL